MARKTIARKALKYLASYTKFRDDAQKMLETKIPYKINPENWGFSNYDFEIIKN